MDTNSMNANLVNNVDADKSPIVPVSNIPELREIPLDRIKASRFWHRRDYEKNLPSMEASIQKHGLQQVPAVIDTQDGLYELIFGHQRYLSYKRMGRKAMICRISNIDPTDAGVLSFIENNDRHAMHPLDIAITLKQIKTEKKCSDDQLAEEIHWSQSSVSEYLGVLDLGDDVLDAVENGTDGTLSFTHAVALSRLKHSSRPNRELEISELQNKTIKYRLSAAELKGLVKTFTEGGYDRLPDRLRLYLLKSKAMTTALADIYLNPGDVVVGQGEQANELRNIAERFDKKRLADLIIKAVDAGWGYETTRDKVLDLIRRQEGSVADEIGRTASAYNTVIDDISKLLNRVRPAYNEALGLAKSHPEQLAGLCQALELLLTQATPLIESIRNTIAQNQREQS